MVRTEIQRAALRLFAERGFDAVTSEEIASAAGVSSSTYFRYCSNKDDLLLGALRKAGSAIVANLAARPAEEAVDIALAQAILDRSLVFADDEQSVRNWRTAILGAPQVLERVALIDGPDRVRLTELVARRMGADPERDLRPGLLVHTMLAAAEFAYLRWLAQGEDDDRSLHQLTARALELTRASKMHELG